MKTSIKLSTLRAAVHCMAKKDMRYYLMGVNVAFKHGAVNRMEVCSTDGHVLSAFSEPLEYEDDAQTADFSIIIPNTALKLAIKNAGKRRALVLESLPDGRYALGDTIFSPVDKRFPDYRRVIAKTTDEQATTPLQFNADLLVRAQDALRDYFTSPKLWPHLTHMRASGVMHNCTNDACVIIMPIRDESLAYQGFFSL